jgi:hypothetical protein
VWVEKKSLSSQQNVFCVVIGSSEQDKRELRLVMQQMDLFTHLMSENGAKIFQFTLN